MFLLREMVDICSYAVSADEAALCQLLSSIDSLGAMREGVREGWDAK